MGTQSATAGIGLGVLGAVLLISVAGISSCLLRRKKKYNLLPSQPLVGDCIDTSKEAGERTDQRHVSKSVLWRSMSLDSWLYEFIAICFSVWCLLASAYLLMTYNYTVLPQIVPGVTLNAVISSLATASKSSLIFVIGECIGQLRWISFRKAAFSSSPKPLSLAQTYDTASRGPWGSFLMLYHDRGRSLVTIGSLIMVLSLAFDPFIQQVMQVPYRQIPEYTREATVNQSCSFGYQASSAEYIPVNLTGVANNALYETDFAPRVNCPSGTCSWPVMPSFEICNRCEDVSSQAIISGCDPKLLNLTSSQNQSILCEVSLPHGSSSGSTLDFLPERDTLYIPMDVVWTVEAQSPLRYSLSSNVYAGVKNPLAVFAHAQLDLPAKDKKMSLVLSQSPALNDLRLKNVTLCALSFCSRSWTVSITNHTTSSNVTEENLGETYSSPPDPQGGSKLCWRVNSTGAGTVTFDSCDLFDIRSFIPYFSMLGSTSRSFRKRENDTTSTWNYSGIAFPNELGSSHSDISGLVMIVKTGLELAMHNAAFSFSKYGRESNGSPSMGVMITSKISVEVHWKWFILPVVLVLSGAVLLGSTAFVNRQKRVSIWKTSALPLLYHGLENSLIPSHGKLEDLSGMEDAAKAVSVSLGLSKTGDRLIFQEGMRLSNPSFKSLTMDGTLRPRVSRRQSW